MLQNSKAQAEAAWDSCHLNSRWPGARYCLRD